MWLKSEFKKSMNEPNEKKYKQLAIFSVIVAEVVITPSVLGGLVYYLMKGRSFQMTFTTLAALLGLGVAIYRIYLLYQQQNKEENQ